jgi:hypothetical protein
MEVKQIQGVYFVRIVSTPRRSVSLFLTFHLIYRENIIVQSLHALEGYAVLDAGFVHNRRRS